MKELHPSAFPALRDAFTGYLHEDFAAEYETPERALAAFYADASEKERRRWRKEARHFLTATETIDFRQVQQLVGRLGSRWEPPSREALVSLLESLERINSRESPDPPA